MRLVLAEKSADELAECIAKDIVPILRAGGVVAVPTDTIYGVTALAQNTEAVRALYHIKGRNAAKPVAICVPEVEQVLDFAAKPAPVTLALLNRLLPGPVTVVLERAPELNPELNPGTSLVGIRVPDHPLTRQLVSACGGTEPLALTSANKSAAMSAVRVEEFADIWSGLAYIIDGGDLSTAEGASDRRGSTVVDLSVKGCYRIIRAGCAAEETTRILEEEGLSPS